MHRAIPRTTARVLAWLLAAVALAVPVRADADNVATPGNFTGYGFDQCVAPTQKSMDTWLRPATHRPRRIAWWRSSRRMPA